MTDRRALTKDARKYNKYMPATGYRKLSLIIMMTAPVGLSTFAVKGKVQAVFPPCVPHVLRCLATQMCVQPTNRIGYFHCLAWLSTGGNDYIVSQLSFDLAHRLATSHISGGTAALWLPWISKQRFNLQVRYFVDLNTRMYQTRCVINISVQMYVGTFYCNGLDSLLLRLGLFFRNKFISLQVLGQD